jgi:RNA polymerase sigma-70 factor (ECF subfamily)
LAASNVELAEVAEPQARVYSPSFARNDEDFVKAFRAGRSDAQAELFRRHHERIAEVLERVLGYDSDLPDLIQEVFVEAITGAASFRGDAQALRPWLVKIAVFRARALIRRRRVWRRFFSMPGEAPEVAAAGSATVEQIHALRRAYALFNRLPTDERIALTLSLIDEMPAVQVGEACGVSKSTIQRTLVKARKRFMKLAEHDTALCELLLGGDT